MSKIRVAVLFGGRSTEHEISLLSAQNIIKALPKDKYEPVLIGIDKTGKWFFQRDSIALFASQDPKKVILSDTSMPMLLSQNSNDHRLITAENGTDLGRIDVLFPILHGTYGEDGSLQGLAKLANLPCVGPGILGSAVGMDKEVMKRLLRDAGIDNAKFVTIRSYNYKNFHYRDVAAQLGNDLFVKPANLGSSVGISYVTTADQFDKAVLHALQYDAKVIVEEKIVGRELECAVLGNQFPEASIVGEVIPKNTWYSYEAKYIDEFGAGLEVPAKISTEDSDRIRALSIKTYQVLECSGMARVDMFMTPDKRLFINEINTLPGFTNISMYPTLWKHSGLSNEELVDKLVQLAIEAHQDFESLKKSV